MSMAESEHFHENEMAAILVDNLAWEFSSFLLSFFPPFLKALKKTELIALLVNGSNW